MAAASRLSSAAQAAHHPRGRETPSTSEGPAGKSHEHEQQQQGDLVSRKDLRVEDFLTEVFDSLSAPLNTPAVELARIWKEQVQEKIARESVVLSHRTSPLVQIMLEQKVRQLLETKFVRVETKVEDLRTMAEKYTACFNQWIDCNTHVNFTAVNKKLLGNLSAKDAWILTFFACCTSQRSKGDNLLQLGLVGCSTSGKSTLFESILMEGSHVTTNEPGVGRYNVGSNPVLMFHDIDIYSLVGGKDVEKIKTICRTEPTVAKVHSSTITLPPLYVFYSSNERLLDHDFDAVPDSAGAKKPAFRWRQYPSQAVKLGRKRISPEHLLAVQMRFIEAFVRSRPPLDKKFLPRSGNFERTHGLLGLCKRVLGILDKYEQRDFHSPYMYLYALKGLCRFADLYSATMEDPEIKTEILNQVFKLVPPEQVDDITKDL